LNDKCLLKLEKSDEESKKTNNNEYIIMRNFIQKENFYTKDLAKVTNLPVAIIRQMINNLGFISFRNRQIYVQRKYLNWIRAFVNDFLVFFNYPRKEVLTRSIDGVNSFMRKINQTKNYKIILLNVLESGELLLFPEELLTIMKNVVKNASWGMTMYYFKELYSIYLNTYPKLNTQVERTADLELSESDDFDADETFEEDMEQVESATLVNPEELVEQNKKLLNDLNESRAVSDFLSMQYDDLMTSIESQKTALSEKNFSSVFRSFNSIENNKALDTFFVAKSALDALKSSGWEPNPPELKSILYVFDLFTNFFKRQNLTTKYQLGEEITITIDNVTNFEYNGQELEKGMKLLARVRSPAWYYKNILISKPSVMEIKEGGK